MSHDCAKNPEDCERVHGGRRGGSSNILLGGLIGALAGVPLSYYFQPSIIRVKYSISDYMRLIPDVINSEYAGNLFIGVLVGALAGAILGRLLSLR